jgi:hypothetical protein
MPHRRGDSTIDHVAVPSSAAVDSVAHHDARTLSDHDAYVVDVDP